MVRTTDTTHPDSTTAYAEGVVSGRIPANRYVRLACQRHLDDLRRKDVWFDPEAPRRFFRFCRKYLRHYKGPMRGQPVILEPWQKFIFGSIYGWKIVDNGVRTDIWRFNFIYIEVPRKNGKTTLCAAGAAFDCAMLDETGAEVYCVATKEDQALLLYNDVAAYIAGSQDLAEIFDILKGKNTIFATESARTSFIRPVGSDSQRLDGLNPISVYADELHAWPKEDLWNVMADSFGARENWHMVAITTAGNNREGICYKKREALINVLEGYKRDDNFFGVIYTLDDEDKDNWKQEDRWFIANPNLGTGKQVRYMRTKYNEAETQPSMLNPFLNKQLNIWTDSEEAWLHIDLWNSRAAKYDWDFLKGKHCTAGMDLAKVNDLSAVAYVFGKQPGLDRIHVMVDFFLPKHNIREKGVGDHVDYVQWAKEGYLQLTPGKTTDYEQIRKTINERREIVRLDKIMYDRHFAYELVTNLTNDNIVMEPMTMWFPQMGPPTAELERLLIEGQVAHPNNSVLNWNARNVVIERNANDEMKPSKELSRAKIDGIVAVIMGLYDVSKNIAKRSKYERQGLTSFGPRAK